MKQIIAAYIILFGGCIEGRSTFWSLPFWCGVAIVCAGFVILTSESFARRVRGDGAATDTEISDSHAKAGIRPMSSECLGSQFECGCPKCIERYGPVHPNVIGMPRLSRTTEYKRPRRA